MFLSVKPTTSTTSRILLSEKRAKQIEGIRFVVRTVWQSWARPQDLDECAPLPLLYGSRFEVGDVPHRATKGSESAFVDDALIQIRAVCGHQQCHGSRRENVVSLEHHVGVDVGGLDIPLVICLRYDSITFTSSAHVRLTTQAVKLISPSSRDHICG